MELGKSGAQGAAHAQTSSTHTAAVLRVYNDERPTINFDDDFDNKVYTAVRSFPPECDNASKQA